jgi:hypothetical protein
VTEGTPQDHEFATRALEKGKGLSILEYCVRLVQVVGFLSKLAAS